MSKIGPLPNSGKIDFILDTAQLSMLEKGLINKLPLDVTVSYPEQPLLGKKRLQLIIKEVHSPGSLCVKSFGKNHAAEGGLDIKTVNGLARSNHYFFDNILIPNSWVLIGVVQGEKPVQIIICFYVQFNFGTYSFKKEDEAEKDFNPQMN
ncbi:MAG: hypothetical protein KBC11_00030 [Candidatus Pacebacteria bacterium]|nr:hypothetical protein [Candidatus Paceibacterota bacterium]